MADYRYLLGSLLTGEVFAELPFTSVSYGYVLNAPGAFQGQMPLQQPDVVAAVVQDSLHLGASTLLVERDGVLVWGGILWTENVDFEAGTYQVNGEGWHSYFRRRILTETLTYTGEEQLDILAGLVDWAQDQTGGNIGVDTGSLVATGVTRDRTYLDTEQKNIGEAMEQLAAVQDGFDFRYVTGGVPGAHTIELVATYPATGRETDLVFELGGQLSALSLTTDATNLVTYVSAVGAFLEGSDVPLMVSVSDEDRLTSMPRLDDVISEADIITTDTLTAHANRRLARGAAPIAIPTASTEPALEPVLGSYIVGDIVTVRADVGLRSVDAQFRISEYAVTVGSAGDENVSLSFASAEVFG